VRGDLAAHAAVEEDVADGDQGDRGRRGRPGAGEGAGEGEASR
jgi:hypothetical protein